MLILLSALGSLAAAVTSPRIPRRDHRGRTPMSNASPARSVANFSITSSPSMSVTCAVCCRHTLSITTEPARMSRSARIAPSLVLYSRPLPGSLSPFHRSAACTIATSGAQPEPFAVTEPAPPSPSGRVAGCYCVARRQARSEPTHGVRVATERRALRSLSTAGMAFIGIPIPWADGILSKDRRSRAYACGCFQRPDAYFISVLRTLVEGCGRQYGGGKGPGNRLSRRRRA
mgnify:CR=1 FL=1